MHRSVQDMRAPDLKFAGSSGEDLERQLQLLVLDDDNYGTRYLSSLPYPGKFYHRYKLTSSTNGLTVLKTDLLYLLHLFY